MQTIHFIVGSKTQRTTPKDWELFDNVYNRPQKAAEVHQMLRQDGARRSPPRQNEVRYEITFLEAQSYKGGGGNKDSDIPVGPYETGHPTEALGREALTADCQKERKD